MTDLELWVENNYPDIYDEWAFSDGDVSLDDDIEDWLEDNYPDILGEYEDWLDGWERMEEYSNERDD